MFLFCVRLLRVRGPLFKFGIPVSMLGVGVLGSRAVGESRMVVRESVSRSQWLMECPRLLFFSFLVSFESLLNVGSRGGTIKPKHEA